MAKAKKVGRPKLTPAKAEKARGRYNRTRREKRKATNVGQERSERYKENAEAERRRLVVLKNKLSGVTRSMAKCTDTCDRTAHRLCIDELQEAIELSTLAVNACELVVTAEADGLLDAVCDAVAVTKLAVDARRVARAAGKAMTEAARARRQAVMDIKHALAEIASHWDSSPVTSILTHKDLETIGRGYHFAQLVRAYRIATKIMHRQGKPSGTAIPNCVFVSVYVDSLWGSDRAAKEVLDRGDGLFWELQGINKDVILRSETNIANDVCGGVHPLDDRPVLHTGNPYEIPVELIRTRSQLNAFSDNCYTRRAQGHAAYLTMTMSKYAKLLGVCTSTAYIRRSSGAIKSSPIVKVVMSRRDVGDTKANGVITRTVVGDKDRRDRFYADTEGFRFLGRPVKSVIWDPATPGPEFAPGLEGVCLDGRIQECNPNSVLSPRFRGEGRISTEVSNRIKPKKETEF